MIVRLPTFIELEVLVFFGLCLLLNEGRFLLDLLLKLGFKSSDDVVIFTLFAVVLDSLSFSSLPQFLVKL